VLKPGDQHVESGGEPLAAVVDPDVLADGDQGREAVGRQRTEELVQLGPDGGVADVLLVDRGRVLLTAKPMVWLSRDPPSLFLRPGFWGSGVWIEPGWGAMGGQQPA
jgi:hypothetical protein